MDRSSNGDPYYGVHCSKATLDSIKLLHNKASDLDIGEQFVDAIRTINERLRYEPIRFGEPLYHLPTKEGLVCLGSVAPLAVRYAVYEDKRLVFILRVWLLTGSES
jgi:hypothetical protein